jgi:ComF family protein
MAADLPEVVEHVRGAVLVPVPLHPARERWRGFNQSALLAKAFARELSVAGCAGLLERARNTATQTRLTREERLRNMRNAFALKAGAELRADLTYIVVDDVFTTGSTLNECCRVLRRSGAKTLKVLTFAHG